MIKIELIKNLEMVDLKNIRVVVFGLGYIGIPILKQLKNNNIDCLGYDVSSQRIEEINLNITKITDTNLIKNCCTNSFEKVIDFSKYHECIYISCVPTLIHEDYSNNYNALESVIENINKIYKENDIVVIESTVGVGKTKELCDNKFKYYCYSPERISPNDNNDVSKINKLLATNNDNINKKIFSLYKKISNNIILIKDKNSIKIAESSKLIENTQRDVNIALMNEYQSFCSKNKININDVLEVANTKWNFGNYKPGLVGGQCIGVDPYYIINANKDTELIRLAREINENKIKETIMFIEEIIKKYDKKDIVILGKTYKPNCASLENSGAFKICKYFNLQSYDPLIDINNINIDNYKIHILLVNQDYFKNYYNTNTLNNKILIDPFGLNHNISECFEKYYTM